MARPPAPNVDGARPKSSRPAPKNPRRKDPDEYDDFADSSDDLESAAQLDAQTDEFDDEYDEFDDAEADPSDTSAGVSRLAEASLGTLPAPCDLVNGVHIALTFDIGESQISVRQLRSLLPGYTFELATRVESPVAVKAYGQLIGRGELIQIDGRLGVRLLEINRDGH